MNQKEQSFETHLCPHMPQTAEPDPRRRVSIFSDDAGWWIQIAAYGAEIKFCPFCGIELSVKKKIEEPPALPVVDESKIEKGEICPKCGSADVTSDYTEITGYTIACYDGPGGGFCDHRIDGTLEFRCNQCGEEWKEKRGANP